MGKLAKSGIPQWILNGTALLGLVAALLFVFVRVYEVKKARAEAARAQTELEQHQREMQERAVPNPQPPRSPIPPSATSRPTPPQRRSAEPEPKRPSPPPQPVQPDDMKLIQGRWRTTRRIGPGGRALAKDDPRHDQTLEVRGSNFRLLVRSPGWKPLVGTFTLDPRHHPKHFDLVGIGPLGYEMELHGIYEVEGDTFRLSIVQVGRDKPYQRPAEFTGKRGGDYFVFARAEGEE